MKKYLSIYCYRSAPLFLLKGVTIPSQRRYVEYLGHLLNSQVPYSMKQILFTGLLITYEQNQMLHSSRLIHSSPKWTSIDLFSSGLSYTVKSADHRIQYQSFEFPLERDSTIVRRDLTSNYSVLHATHKHFIPPANQLCQIPLEEDVLIEIFLTKARRGRPVRDEDNKRWTLDDHSRLSLLGKTLPSVVQHVLFGRTKDANHTQWRQGKSIG